LIHIHKALIANRDVISAIEKRYLEEFKDEDLRSFRDLYHDTAQLIDLVSTSRDVLTSILDMYLSSVSNNMNKVVKTLTALSAFVLIPTLIASIYGMNFHGGDGAHPWNMPELYWQHGYLFALGLIALSFIGTFIYFKKKDWL
jgi:magnesium transporter